MNIEQPGASSFTQLSDVPKTYFGAGGRILTVNPFEIGIDFNPPGGSATWGGISGILSNQTDLQAVLDAKQTTLVSGTNIKTINGASVLGAGNIVIAGGAVNFVSDVATDTILGRITAGSGDSEELTPTQVRTLINVADGATANVGNVVDADVRGGAVDLNARLGTISNFASPNAGGVIPGQFYDNSFQGSASGLLAGVANRIDLAPYYTSQTFTIDQIGVSVSTAIAASTVKIVIYSTSAVGWPDVLLYESAPIDTAVINYRFEALTFTFSSGVQYWVGVRSSSTATLRTVATASSVNLGLTASNASSYATILRRTLTYATAATSPWAFVNSDRVANVTPPSIRFRAA